MEKKLNSHSKIFGSSIIMLGSFSPQLFQPEWFRTNKLLRDNEIDTAKIAVIHPTITQFEAGKFKIVVEQNRFSIETTDQSQLEPLKDLAKSVADLFSVVPIVKAGINFFSHLQCSNTETWHGLGHFLTPKTFWDSFTKKPGMQSLMIKADSYFATEGYVRIKAEPSSAITDGVFIHINHHMAFQGAKDSKPFSDSLEQNWKIGLEKAFEIIENFSKKIDELEAKK